MGRGWHGQSGRRRARSAGALNSFRKSTRSHSVGSRGRKTLGPGGGAARATTRNASRAHLARGRVSPMPEAVPVTATSPVPRAPPPRRKMETSGNNDEVHVSGRGASGRAREESAHAAYPAADGATRSRRARDDDGAGSAAGAPTRLRQRGRGDGAATAAAGGGWWRRVGRTRQFEAFVKCA